MDRQEQFIAAIQEHQRLINKVLYLYADSEEQRKDLRQEILSQAWSAYPRFRKDAKFSTWLYRVALNTALSALKKRKRQTRVVEVLKTNSSDFQAPINEKELLEYVLQALNAIERSIVLLLTEGYDRTEIAELLGISEGNLRIKIFRIRKKLRAYGVERYLG